MPEWAVWIIVACVLGVGEMLTVGFFLAPFAVGAVLGALTAGLGVGLVVQLAVFLVTSTLLLGVVRPIARRHLRQPARLRTGPEALVGQTGVVLDRVVNAQGMGSVRIDGDVWTARSLDEDEVLEPGTRVWVIEIRGATAVVSQ